jgi:ubiquitin-activating enzyme E1
MDQYSRQIAAIGLDAMKNMRTLTVLIIGQKGVGIELSKDIILAGPQAVTVYDNDLVSIADLGTNFYLRPEHVGTLFLFFLFR